MENVRLALLICLYLTRSGRATIRIVQDGLQIKGSKLSPVFRVLTEAEILKKGKDGYELNGNPKVSDLFDTFYPLDLIGGYSHYHTTGEHEARAALNFSNCLAAALAPLLKKSIRMVGNDQLLIEVNYMNKVEDGATN